MLPQEEFAKVIFAKIVSAILEMQQDEQYLEYFDKYRVNYPSIIEINGTHYGFGKVENPDG